MRRKLTVALAALSVAALAGTGLAATGVADTLFTDGYDDVNHTLVWGASDVEGAVYDCTVADGTYQYEAVAGEVTQLQQGGSDVTYPAVDNTSTTVAYGGTGGECDLTATNVEGPNGQVNHGQVVSNFRKSLKAAGIQGGGCLVSVIAQSDYGKGDQQVQVSDVTTTTVPTTLVGEVDLTTNELTCQHGNPHADDEGSATGHGKPEGVGQGKPAWAGQGGND